LSDVGVRVSRGARVVSEPSVKREERLGCLRSVVVVVVVVVDVDVEVGGGAYEGIVCGVIFPRWRYWFWVLVVSSADNMAKTGFASVSYFCCTVSPGSFVNVWLP